MTTQEHLKNLLQTITGLELAILVGSQAQGSATPQSDWDIAVRWKKYIQGLARLDQTGILKQKISDAMDIHKDQIDFIEMTTARLAMRAVIAESGVLQVLIENAIGKSKHLLKMSTGTTQPTTGSTAIAWHGAY